MSNLPNHLFVSSFDGALYDTRIKNWPSQPPLRANYSAGHNNIDTIADLKAALRHGKRTQIGLYPLYFIASDGEALSFDAVRTELRNVMDSIATRSNNGWRVVACDINYEDDDLFCAHTNKKIECA